MKRFAPAAARNREPILRVLRRVLPERGLVLEIGSGTGQHLDLFARALPSLAWQPSDVDAEALASVDAYRLDRGATNFLAPIELDASSPQWPIAAADAVISSNVVHISPWSIAEGLFRGASSILGRGAPLVLYGPFRFDGEFTAPSNEAFDQSLKSRDPRWGVRDVEDLRRVAAARSFDDPEIFSLPANNHVLVFRKAADPEKGPNC